MDKKYTLTILAIMIMASIIVLNTQTEVKETVEGLADLSSESASAQCSVLATVYGYNNGVKVTEPVIASPFSDEGAEIDELRVNVSWVATGSGVDWDTYLLEGALVVDQLNKYDNWIEKYRLPFSSYEKIGSKLNMILVLGTDICLPADITDGGWFLEVSIPITVTADDEIGIPLSADVVPQLKGTVNILWSSELHVAGDWDF